MRRTAITRLLTTALVSAILAVATVPAAAFVVPVAGNEPLPLRASPNADAAQVGVVQPGGDFNVVETTADGWSAIVVGGQRVWLAPGSLKKAEASGTVTATVAASVLNVRSGPGTSYGIVTTARRGQQLPVLSESGSWVKVTVSGKTGWVSRQYVTIARIATEVPNVTGEQQATVSVAKANIRTGADTSYSIKWQVARGTVLPVRALANGWAQVVYKAQLGWVDASLLSLTDTARPTSGVVYSAGPGAWRVDYPATGTITGAKVNLRSGPSLSSKSLGQVTKGTRLPWRGVANGWVKTAYKGQDCYVIKTYFRSDGAPERSIGLTLDGLEKTLSLKNVGAVTVSQTSDGLGLLLKLPVKLAKARLDVNAGEFKSIIVDGDVVALTFAQRPRYTVTTAGADTSISFTTRITAVTWRQEADRDIVTLQAAGDLPGALASAVPVTATLGATADFTTLPGPIAGTLAADASGLRLAFANQAAAVVMRHAPNEITFELLKPGLAGRTIVIDPGHGGSSPGAVGSGGTIEKNVNLAISLALRDRLVAAGARVFLTRESDVSLVPPEQAAEADYKEDVSRDELSRRAALAAEKNADIFISIHNNSIGYASGQSGTETYYYSGAANGVSARRLAELVQIQVTSNLPLRNRGAKDDNYYVVKHADVPAVLFEGAFLSCPTDEQFLASPEGPGQMAEQLFRAIQQYFGQDPVAP